MRAEIPDDDDNDEDEPSQGFNRSVVEDTPVKREDGVVAVSSKTINITTTYDDGAASIVRKFKFHETKELDKVTKCAISYVFDAKLLDSMTEL